MMGYQIAACREGRRVTLPKELLRLDVLRDEPMLLIEDGDRGSNPLDSRPGLAVAVRCTRSRAI